MGWTFDQVQDLPLEVYGVLCEELAREAHEAERDRQRQSLEVLQ